MTADEALGALVGTLEQLRQTFPQDKATWDSRLVVRLAVERLWITAGNLAEVYRIERGVTTGVEPWSELVGIGTCWLMPFRVTSPRTACSPTPSLTSSGSSAPYTPSWLAEPGWRPELHDRTAATANYGRGQADSSPAASWSQPAPDEAADPVADQLVGPVSVPQEMLLWTTSDDEGGDGDRPR